MKKQIREWEKSALIYMTDLTYYNRISSEGWELEIPEDYIENEIVTLVNIHDAEDFEFEELSEDKDYFCDINKKCVLAIGRYVGCRIKTIIRKDQFEEEAEIEIKSRFANIEVDDLIKIVVKQNNDEWLKFKQKNKKAEIKIQNQTFYDLAALYEMYVRLKVEEILNKECLNKEWQLQVEEDAKKNVFSSEEACNWLKQESKIEKCLRVALDDVYLQGELIPDIILYNEKNKEYIIYDVKYKQGTYNQGTRSDRLQILAYAYMWDCKQIGHIFPEKSSKEDLTIACGNKNVSYREVECNTKNSFKIDSLMPK